MADQVSSEQRNPFFFMQGDTLVITHDSGFFSNCTVALFAITRFFGHFRKLPCEVDFSRTFRRFTDEEQIDSYLAYFKHNREIDIAYTSKFEISWHSQFDYRQEPFAWLAPFVRKYFGFSDEVARIEEQLTEKYKMDPSRTLAICYRGTDKSLDVVLGPYSEYIEIAKTFLRLEPDLQVLVQTDEKQFLDYCRQELDNIISFEEMPVTSTNIAMHDIIPPDRKIEWTRTFVAVTSLLSKCKYIVNHTGNVARWICLYRGGTHGMAQYFRPYHLSQNAIGNFWLR